MKEEKDDELMSAVNAKFAIGEVLANPKVRRFLRLRGKWRQGAMPGAVMLAAWRGIKDVATVPIVVPKKVKKPAPPAPEAKPDPAPKGGDVWILTNLIDGTVRRGRIREWPVPGQPFVLTKIPPEEGCVKTSTVIAAWLPDGFRTMRSTYSLTKE